MLRASFDIKCGAGSIKDRVLNIVNGKYDVSLICRNQIAGLAGEISPEKINVIPKDDVLFLNGRVVFGKEFLKVIISKNQKNTVCIYKNELIYASLSKDKVKEFRTDFEKTILSELNFKEYFTSQDLKVTGAEDNEDLSVLCYPWDAVKNFLNGGLNSDLEIYLNNSRKKFISPKKSEFMINPKGIFISPKADLLPGTVLDASEGKIIIEENCRIEPFCYIKGPAYIGKNTLVKSGAKIYGPCSIGKNSKVAGEIAESVFHSYVNKQHDGFVGHSYICPFVNLGADTVTSDLKNNYSKIRIKMNSAETDFDTGMMFLGSIIGDHSKTSINTMLNTGTVAGIFANIFGGGFPEKTIGSFTWNEPGKAAVKYQFGKAVETAVKVMARRGITMSADYEKLLSGYSE